MPWPPQSQAPNNVYFKYVRSTAVCSVPVITKIIESVLPRTCICLVNI